MRVKEDGVIGKRLFYDLSEEYQPASPEAVLDAGSDFDAVIIIGR